MGEGLATGPLALVRKRGAVRLLNRSVRPLLVQVGAAEWGNWLGVIPRFMIRRPGWDELKRMTSSGRVESPVAWIAQHAAQRRRAPGGRTIVLHESYTVRLYVTPEGEPDHFSAEGSTTVDSETFDLVALGKALRSVMRAGPMTDWHCP